MTQGVHKNAWDKLDNEGDSAYEAFLVYRNQPRGQRSQTQAAATVGKNVSLINRWSSAHNWVKRVQAWDDAKQKELDDELLREVSTTNKAIHDYCTGLRNNIVAALMAKDLSELSVQDLLTAFDIINKNDSRALGQEGRNGPRGGAANGAPSLVKLYQGIDLGEV